MSLWVLVSICSKAAPHIIGTPDEALKHQMYRISPTWSIKDAVGWAYGKGESISYYRVVDLQEMDIDRYGRTIGMVRVV